MKYQRFAPSGCKGIGIRRFELVAKTQLLLNILFMKCVKKMKMFTWLWLLGLNFLDRAEKEPDLILYPSSPSPFSPSTFSSTTSSALLSESRLMVRLHLIFLLVNFLSRYFSIVNTASGPWKGGITKFKRRVKQTVKPWTLETDRKNL